MVRLNVLALQTNLVVPGLIESQSYWPFDSSSWLKPKTSLYLNTIDSTNYRYSPFILLKTNGMAACRSLCELVRQVNIKHSYGSGDIPYIECVLQYSNLNVHVLQFFLFVILHTLLVWMLIYFRYKFVSNLTVLNNTTLHRPIDCFNSFCKICIKPKNGLNKTGLP